MKPVAMSAEHLVALQIVMDDDPRGEAYEWHKSMREILELVRSLESGEAVVVERGEIEGGLEMLEANTDVGLVAYLLRGWLTSDTPKERTDG